MPKLLLTSVCRPFGGPGEGSSVGAELFHAQVTRAQGPFSLRQVIRVWGLDYIAENLATPTVVLHYPSRRELERELRRGGYTHVGVNFVVATFHKVREMVPLIRRHLPHAEIVLGGYGTVLPDELLTPLADHVCREEGVRYMRRLLGEPVATPIRPPHAPIPAVKVLSLQRPRVVGHVTAGLGCANGCDFCCTTHFFDRRYQPFLHSGRELYEALLATREQARADGVRMGDFFIIDEDFFSHESRAREFLACVREGGTALSLAGFGSVRGLSRFTAREVAAMGFDMVWTGFEGRRAGYGKLRGRPLPELYRDLRAVGCAQLASMIIGFPYQDEATIRAEFDELMALEPALIQCLIYFAFPGTPLHRQVVDEGRYLPRYLDSPDLRLWDGFAMHFKHPRIGDPHRLEQLQRELYAADYRRLGPSVLRLGRVWLSGYQTLRNDADPLLAARAERLRRRARSVLPLTAAAMVFGPGQDARRTAARLRRDLIRLTGEPTAAEHLAAAAAPLMYLLTRGLGAAGLLQQPRLLRVSHNGGPHPSGAHTRHVLETQAGRLATLPAALRDDVVELLRRLGGHFLPSLDPRRHLRPEYQVVTRRGSAPRARHGAPRPPIGLTVGHAGPSPPAVAPPPPGPDAGPPA